MPALVGFLLIAGSATDVLAGNCPTPPMRRAGLTPPVHLPASRTLKPYSITRTVKHHYDAPLGLGFLEVGEAKNQHFYDWMFELTLPLWQAPDASYPLGWLVGGHVYTKAGAEALTGTGMVETGYEHTSFIVWETHKEWLRLKLTGGLHVWANRCHLKSANIELTFVPWEAFFRRHAKWLHFRKPVPHKLRASPDVRSAAVTTIGLNHKLILLEVTGDWMKVAVEQPDTTCGDPGRRKTKPPQHHGWVEWRDARGPWVYIYTRGC